MRDHDEPVDHPPPGWSETFPLPDAAFVAATWPDAPPAGVGPAHPERARSASMAMLVLGVALLWPFPLGGALLLGSAGLGLTACWRATPGGIPAPLPAPTGVDIEETRPLPRQPPVDSQCRPEEVTEPGVLTGHVHAAAEQP